MKDTELSLQHNIMQRLKSKTASMHSWPQYILRMNSDKPYNIKYFEPKLFTLFLKTGGKDDLNKKPHMFIKY